MVTFVHDTKDRSSLSSDFVAKLVRDRNGVLWAATWDGLSRFDSKRGTFKTYKPDAKYRGLNFYSIALSRQGTLWLGSNLGLYQFDPRSEHFKTFQHDHHDPNSISDSRVNSVSEASDGSVWIGTQNGLDQLESATFRIKHFGERNGMAGNVVSCLLEDRTGRLWMSTNKGVSSFTPASREFKNYSVTDGLPGPDLTGWNACSQSAQGEMFFGGFSGAAAFYPDQVLDQKYVPPIVLTDFRIFGLPVPVTPGSPLKAAITHATALTLLPAQNIFSIEFSALSYFNPSTNRYRYRLQPLQENWSEVSSDQRTATYTTLPPGLYTFCVQGATSRGNWSEPGVSVRIEILPPWWRTWPFAIFCLTLISILTWVGYRYRIYQITRIYALRLEGRVSERTRIARELHDTLLQSFQGLMFRLQAVRDLLPQHPSEAIPVLETALEHGDEAIDEARTAVEGLRATETTQQDLAHLVASICESLQDGHTPATPVRFRVSTQGLAKPVNPTVMHELHQIAREALCNAFKHAHARNIEAEIVYLENALALHFRDDGCGLTQELTSAGHRDKHWGLLGMRERSERVRGVLEIWTDVAAGTEVRITIPGSIAYQAPASKSKFNWLKPRRRSQGYERD